MRLDKYLKVSRIIKRRTVAKEAGEGGRVSINGKTAKPSSEVKEGDVIETASAKNWRGSACSPLPKPCARTRLRPCMRCLKGRKWNERGGDCRGRTRHAHGAGAQ